MTAAPARSRRSTVLVAVVGCALLAVATARLWPASPERHPWPPGGPLFANAGEGSSSVSAPPQGGAYRASFGAFVLCTRVPGAVPVVQSVAPTFGTPAPTRFHALLRVVTASYIRAHRRMQVTDFIPLGFSLGRPPFFGRGRHSHLAPGRYVHDPRGYRVTTRCGAASRDGGRLSTGRLPHHTIAELMLVMRSAPRGAVTRSFTISYTVDGRPYRLPVLWSLVACGPRVHGYGCGQRP